MSQIIYPKALNPGDRIAITAPSAGVNPEHHARLNLVLEHLRNQGFDVIEGRCLRQSIKHVSAPKEERAQEFMKFWEDASIAAIMPPWGGEVLVEILPLLDFDRIRKAVPKWVSGFSDVSTLLFPLTLNASIATLHGANFMDLAPSQTDPLTNGLMKVFKLNRGDEFHQNSSEKFQLVFNDFGKVPGSPLNLTEETRWKSLDSKFEKKSQFRGRIIGGCLDTVARLVGTPFGDLPKFIRNFASEKVILYFENCEMPPCELIRTLWNIRLAGWMDGLAGILIGRSSGPEATSSNNLSYIEALHSVLDDLSVPVLYDADIGHRPPQLNLINGSLGEVTWEGGRATVIQKLV